jgi:hypothetical protein
VLPEAHPEDARAAITLLGMCANSEVSIVTSNIQAKKGSYLFSMREQP